MEPLYLLYFEDETTIFNLVRAILENTHPDGLSPASGRAFTERIGYPGGGSPRT